MYKLILSGALVLTTFTGCSLITSSNDSYKFKYFQSTSTTDFSELSNDLLSDLCPTITNLRKSIKDIRPLYVTDFVNLDNLDNNSKLGFILSDELKTSVTQNCNWSIKQVEFTKYLSLGQNGTKLLSRDTHQIKNKQMDNNTFALVGTYMVTQRQLIMYLKLINLKNGVILKASTKRISLTEEIKNLERHNKPKPTQPNIYQPMVL